MKHLFRPIPGTMERNPYSVDVFRTWVFSRHLNFIRRTIITHVLSMKTVYHWKTSQRRSAKKGENRQVLAHWKTRPAWTWRLARRNPANYIEWSEFIDCTIRSRLIDVTTASDTGMICRNLRWNRSTVDYWGIRRCRSVKEPTYIQDALDARILMVCRWWYHNYSLPHG